MKQFFRKIVAILMTFVVLFSTLSFTISEHYCGDHLVDSSLFSKVKTCSMDMQKSSSTNDCSIHSKSCCKDVVKQVEGQSELITDVSTISINQQIFIASFIYSYINLFEGLDKNIVPFKNYIPPLVHRDMQILLQSFRI